MTIHSLTNPGAETGDTTGWTNDTGSLAVRSANPSPHSGSYYFYGGANLETKASQEVDLVADGVSTIDIDNGILTFVVSWYQTTYSGSDKAEIQIRFKDSSKIEIQTDSAGLTANTVQSWELRTFAPQIPANTRYIDIIMHMYRYAGTNNDGYIDDISASTEYSNCRFSQAVVEVIKENELPKNARLSQAVVEVISLNITSTTTTSSSSTTTTTISASSSTTSSSSSSTTTTTTTEPFQHLVFSVSGA
jgi:hypothetical protein